MKKFKRFLKWLSITFFLVFIGLAIFIQTIDFSMSEEEILRAFQGREFSPTFQIIETEERQMHYVSIGDTSKQTILFVHGSPGSWDNFIGFLSDPLLLEKYKMISVDRPGFGKSDAGIPERSLVKQASDIASVLKKEKSSAILVGHSYGGPVITRMAIDYPELVEGLIIVAGSVDPELEKTKWFQIPVHYKILSWILPKQLYSTNEEIIALKKELEIMKPFWANITKPVSIIQGGKDTLVPKENATFAKERLINAPVNMVEIPEMNHFVPWNSPQLIRKEMDRISSLVSNE